VGKNGSPKKGQFPPDPREREGEKEFFGWTMGTPFDQKKRGKKSGGTKMNQGPLGKQH